MTGNNGITIGMLTEEQNNKMDRDFNNSSLNDTLTPVKRGISSWIIASDVFSSITPRVIRAVYKDETNRQYTLAQMLRLGLVGSDIWDFSKIEFLPFYTTLSDGSTYYHENKTQQSFTGLDAGTHYYLYVAKTSAGTMSIVASTSSTTPGDSYTAYALIGGFETMCVSVTSSNTPNTVTSGISAGQIIPNSIWCSSFRPTAYNPAGMAYCDESTLWCDIYLQSGTGANTASTNGSTITDIRFPQNHFNDMVAVGKFLPSDIQFTQMAYGTQSGYAINGATDPSTTGGHVNTDSKRIISCYFLEDCCGVLWQWLSDIGPIGGNSWTSRTLEDSYASVGSSYGNPYCHAGGGSWSDSSKCGVCSRYERGSFATVAASISARGLSHTKLW